MTSFPKCPEASFTLSCVCSVPIWNAPRRFVDANVVAGFPVLPFEKQNAAIDHYFCRGICRFGSGARRFRCSHATDATGGPERSALERGFQTDLGLCRAWLSRDEKLGVAAGAVEGGRVPRAGGRGRRTDGIHRKLWRGQTCGRDPRRV